MPEAGPAPRQADLRQDRPPFRSLSLTCAPRRASARDVALLARTLSGHFTSAQRQQQHGVCVNIEGQPIAEFNHPRVPDLLRVLTEATRATPRGGPTVYIPPSGAEDANANYNHFVFGQRGSGKSSLLRNLELNKRLNKKASVWIDQEVFTALEYPDVLVSCVLDISEGLHSSLLNSGAIKRPRWYDRLGLGRRIPSNSIEARLDRMIANLRTLKLLP